MNNDIETRPMIDDEARLVGQLKQMDEDAWNRLFGLYAPDLRWDITNSLKKRGLGSQAVDDIEQETWLTAVQQIGDFVYQGPGKLYNWLRVIAFNHVRTFSKQGELSSIDAFEVEANEADTALDKFLYSIRQSDNTIEDEIELRQQLAVLDHALRRLSARDREILLRRLIWDETPRELAREYPSLNARSISQTLLRAKKAILVFLESADPHQGE